MHLIYPQTFCITIVFDFTLDDCNTQEELETSALPFFLFFLFFFGGGGWEREVNEVYHGVCENGD